MKFRPIKENHAIDVAGFGLGLSRPLSWPSLEAVIKSPLEWRKALPAVDLSHVVDLQINPQTGAPANRVMRGVEFSHKRPDGTAEWLLSAAGPDIKVETSAYTRWSEVWSKAGDILVNASGQIALHEKDRDNTIVTISLILTDAFLTAEAEPDYREIFISPCDLLPSAAFERGPLWHAYSGWFDSRPDGSVLNQLNIDVRKNIGDSTQSTDHRISVAIQHNQFFRPNAPIAFNAEHAPQLERLILEEIPLMHASNLNVMRKLLTPTMQDRIKLNTDD